MKKYFSVENIVAVICNFLFVGLLAAGAVYGVFQVAVELLY